MHYARWKSWGDVKEDIPSLDDISENDRFDKYVDKNQGDGCWQWIGTTGSTGYGSFSNSEQRRVSAHRFSYERHTGQVPDGFEIDHLCRNRGCVNPVHLEAVTQRENILRSFNPAGINGRKTHCIHGHEFTEDNTRIEIYGSGVHRKCKVCARDRWNRNKVLRTGQSELEIAGTL